MDLFELISRSEWPALTGATLYFLRRPLSKLLDRISITKLDAWGLSAEFEKRLDQVEQVTGTPPSLEVNYEIRQSRNVESENARERLGIEADDISWLTSDPRNRILIAWKQLEKSLKGQHAKNSPSPFIYVNSSEQLGYSQEQIRAILGLKHLARQVETGRAGAVDEAEAVRFETAARRLISPDGASG